MTEGTDMITSGLRTTLAQLNPVVGDIVGNLEKIRETYFDADARGSDLVVTPELSLTGYPLEDLANTGEVLDAAAIAVEVLKKATRGRHAVLLVGVPLRDDDNVYNAVVALGDGKLLAVVRKKHLPNYGVFDEKRNFSPDPGPQRPITVNGVRIGVIICEDCWTADVAAELHQNGAQLLVVANASPFRPCILESRVRDVARPRVTETGLPLLYVNTVGGQDEVVFDGGSFFMNAAGERLLQLPQWEECVMDCDTSQSVEALSDGAFPEPNEGIWRAMVLGLRDYVRKSGFTDVVLGLSGGMDSAAVAAVAGDALGAEHVHCVRLPSAYTSELSNRVARDMCDIWGISLDTVPINPVVEAAVSGLCHMALDGLKKLSMENMQARIRGFLLMTLSNDRDWLLLSTGNKSEIAVGYATLYGDMCGGYNPLKDVFKTTVYAVSAWRNANRPHGLFGPDGVVIPQEIIDRPPSAELSPGQLDTDSLPPYPVLDAILRELVEEQASVEDIIAKGHPGEVVLRVYRMLKRAEYKRRQGAPGPKTTYRAFTRDRRVPIVNGFDPAMRQTLSGMLGE